MVAEVGPVDWFLIVPWGHTRTTLGVVEPWCVRMYTVCWDPSKPGSSHQQGEVCQLGHVDWRANCGKRRQCEGMRFLYKNVVILSATRGNRFTIWKRSKPGSSSCRCSCRFALSCVGVRWLTTHYWFPRCQFCVGCSCPSQDTSHWEYDLWCWGVWTAS